MITSSHIVEKLKDFVKSTEINQSSHWESRLKSKKYDDFSKNLGWHQKHYSFKPIFFHKYHVNIKHCLIDYSIKT